MIYNSGKNEYSGWILKEEKFPLNCTAKCESIMCQGNGYLGLRASMEEYKNSASNGLYVAGTFDFIENDLCTELPNAPDITNMQISVDGQMISPEYSTDYSRTLNLKTGLLSRNYKFVTTDGKKLKLEFLRVVSLKDFHLIAQKVNIVSDKDCKLEIVSGIDGRVYDAQHFSPVKTSCKNGLLNMISKTKQSGILFSVFTSHNFTVGNKRLSFTSIESRSTSEYNIFSCFKLDLKANKKLCVTKISNVFTSRDKELNNCGVKKLVSIAEKHIIQNSKKSFEEVYTESKNEWESRIWSTKDIQIKTPNESDRLAIRFAIYHLTVMSPTHDNRMNIGAKGLSGPGYRGHTFWDTEIFMLPYFIFTSPDEAKSLLEYRYNGLKAAKRKAKDFGFMGAMFPWESAWITDGEATPQSFNMGLAEHHITADVAMGVLNYYICTGDDEFMKNSGYELIFETAEFWRCRAEYNRKTKLYEFKHVIGPDEYKEDVNNNAYTNYLAWYNLKIAVDFAENLEKSDKTLYDKFKLSGKSAKWLRVKDRIYLPRINGDGLLPQDDTYLTLKDITDNSCSVSQMRESAHKKIKKYGMSATMVSKQADVMLLMLLFEDLFTYNDKIKNFYFYEKRCLHESSLSLSTYCTLAADIGEAEMAYELYHRASMIDMGQDMYSSDEGIHSASLGGIWQCTVYGFMGVRVYGNELRIQPHLPAVWDEAVCQIMWQGQRLKLSVNKSGFTVRNLTGTKETVIINNGKKYALKDVITVES